MVTAEDIARVRLFAGLDFSTARALARVSADLALPPGEFAAQQGSDRALFAVLDGRIEATRRNDGIERIVGERNVGDVFGEVPIMLGTVFPVGFRAAEPSRVLRIEPRDYHEFVALYPQIAADVGKLAAHRMSGARGLQGLAENEEPPRAIVAGHRWDAACVDLRRFLDRNQISYTWVEDPEAAEEWGAPMPPESDWPAIRLIGGRMVVKPQP